MHPSSTDPETFSKKKSFKNPTVRPSWCGCPSTMISTKDEISRFKKDRVNWNVKKIPVQWLSSGVRNLWDLNNFVNNPESWRCSSWSFLIMQLKNSCLVWVHCSQGTKSPCNVSLDAWVFIVGMIETCVFISNVVRHACVVISNQRVFNVLEV